MQLVVQEGASVDVTIVELHFAVPTLVVLPNTRESAAVNPRNCALTITSATFPVTFVNRVLKDTVLTWQRALVLHGPVTARPAILERAFILVTILEGNHPQTTKKS